MKSLEIFKTRNFFEMYVLKMSDASGENYSAI